MTAKTININGKELALDISELSEHQSSGTSFFNIHFVDKGKHSCLHVWFSYMFMQTSPEAKNLDIDKIINDEVNNLLDDIWENLFDNEDYFVLYTPDGKIVNQRFSPFIMK